MSIIVATHNRCAACRRAVDSALSQVPSPLEVIVCDDGSTDDTRAVFQRWARTEKRLEYVRLPANTGIPAVVRNAGIVQATGDWLAFLDDDDEWLPGKLRAQYAVLNPEFDVVAANARRRSGGLYFSDESIRTTPRRGDILRTNPIILSTAVARRSLVAAAGGFPAQSDLCGLEDYGLWLELADAGARFVVLRDVVAVYDDRGHDRLSRRQRALHEALARHATRRWLRRPADRELVVAATVHSFRSLKVTSRAAARRMIDVARGRP